MVQAKRVSRRSFLHAGSAALLGGMGLYAYGSQAEAWRFEIVRHDLALPALPDAFDGFTIAQISDLHFGAIVSPHDLAPAIEAVRALNADAIVATGDFVTRVRHGEPDMIVEALSGLSAPEGVFGVLGNHDWPNGLLVAESLGRAGVTVLQNRHIAWRREDQRLYLGGIDDVCAGRHDLGAALAGIPSEARVVLLAHEPDFADIAALDGRVMLQLSGHSHGGQVCLPGCTGLFFPRWGRKYTRGLYTVGTLTEYTNRGLGMIGLPVRFACRPEITLFTLRCAAPA